jgi:hypothetical protein
MKCGGKKGTAGGCSDDWVKFRWLRKVGPERKREWEGGEDGMVGEVGIVEERTCGGECSTILKFRKKLR